MHVLAGVTVAAVALLVVVTDNLISVVLQKVIYDIVIVFQVIWQDVPWCEFKPIDLVHHIKVVFLHIIRDLHLCRQSCY